LAFGLIEELRFDQSDIKSIANTSAKHNDTLAKTTDQNIYAQRKES
jgi:hypothetical protein